MHTIGYDATTNDLAVLSPSGEPVRFFRNHRDAGQARLALDAQHGPGAVELPAPTPILDARNWLAVLSHDKRRAYTMLSEMYGQGGEISLFRFALAVRDELSARYDDVCPVGHLMALWKGRMAELEAA